MVDESCMIWTNRVSFATVIASIARRFLASTKIRNIKEAVNSRLRIQAAFHGHPMVDEAREIPGSGLNPEQLRPGSMVASIPARFSQSGRVELPAVQFEPMREPPAFQP